MSFIPKQKKFSREWFSDYSLIVVGVFLIAIAFDFFIAPHKIVPGGIYGVSIIVHHLTVGLFPLFPNGLPIGLVGLCIDVPLTYIGIRILGPKFGVKTVVGFILLSFFIDGIELIRPDSYQPLVDDMLLSSIFGGIISGLGLGLVFKSRATSGGTDIIAMIIRKYTGLPLGQLLIYVDSFVVLLGLIAFREWEIPLYGWIIIFITGKVIDSTLQGASIDKAVLIISDKHEIIKDTILIDLDRGGTYLNGSGLYTGDEKRVIFTVIPRREVMILQAQINKVDPDAFITIMNASEIYGEGFQSLQNKVEDIGS